MRVVGKKVFERLLESHTDKKIRLPKGASKLMFLHYIIFMKKLARECDDICFRQRKVQIKGDTVALCSPKLLTAFCETEKIVLKAPKSMRRSSTVVKQEKQSPEKDAEKIYDNFDEEVDNDLEEASGSSSESS